MNINPNPFFSPANPGFYFEQDFGTDMPRDAVEISVERYQELLADLGKGWRLMAGPDGKPIAVAPPPPTAQEVTDYLIKSIDIAADNALRVVVGDPLRAVEYDRVAAEAQVFKDAGYPANAVPRSVAAWAINGRNATDAANDILREAQQYNELLNSLREARLAGKAQVRASIEAGKEAQARQWATDTIAAIRTIALTANSPRD